jgi:hypothetical protein
MKIRKVKRYKLLGFYAGNLMLRQGLWNMRGSAWLRSTCKKFERAQ